MFSSFQSVRTACLALTVLLVSGQPSLTQQPSPAQQKDIPADNGIEVQARGPVHEGYARPFDKNPAVAPVVPKKPPAPIPEEPPDQKPEGKDVQWIPGYWAWDTDKNDYLWVSGFWRVPPPGRQWLPGHWAQADAGWQWISGFWLAANADLQYVPEPPPSVDNGPSVPAPDDNSNYIPGCWQYRNSSYLWRPGYWHANDPNWIWNPSYYSYTPSGYCYVNGYWDYPLADRGLLFAPVYFNQPLWQNPGWCYRPGFGVGFGGLFSSLFVGPYRNHFFFGDYYDPFYARAGFWPWHSWGRNFHDPLFNHEFWEHRGDRNWYGGLRNDYWARRNGDLPRPARTLALQNAQFQGAHGFRNGAANAPHLVTPLNQLANRGVPLTRLTSSQLAQQRATVQNFHNQSVQRNRTETAGMAVPNRTPRPFGPPQNRQSFYSGARGNSGFAQSRPVQTPRDAMPSRQGTVIRERPQNSAASRFNQGLGTRSTAPSAGPGARSYAAPRSNQGPAARYAAPSGGQGARSYAAPRFSQASGMRYGAPSGGHANYRSSPSYSRPASPSRGGGGGGHGGGGHAGGGGHGGGNHGGHH